MREIQLLKRPNRLAVPSGRSAANAAADCTAAAWVVGSLRVAQCCEVETHTHANTPTHPPTYRCRQSWQSKLSRSQQTGCSMWTSRAATLTSSIKEQVCDRSLVIFVPRLFKQGSRALNRIVPPFSWGMVIASTFCMCSALDGTSAIMRGGIAAGWI